MGADGGVCWVETTNLKRALELLYPVSAYLEQDDGPNDVAALANTNELCKHHDALCSTYGSYQEVSLYDLRELLLEIKAIHPRYGQEPSEKSPFTGLTWGECILEIQTRPEWVYVEKGEIERCILFNNTTLKKIFGMKIIDWANELLEIVDIENIQYVETWT